jgi:DNA-binding response OmpR family regulator
MPCIVVVEDQPDIRALLGDVLEAEGYRAILLADPAQLTSALLEVEPDLFLLDMMLLRSTGIGVAQELRTGRFAQVPMIAMTASVLMAHMARHSGQFQTVLRKPFDLDDLCAAIDHCLVGVPNALDNRVAQDRRGRAERLAFGDAR